MSILKSYWGVKGMPESIVENDWIELGPCICSIWWYKQERNYGFQTTGFPPWNSKE